jgi:crossover junction endodeoxyribonuclease RuvC
MTVFIGLDPGVSGAIAILAPNGVTFADMPVLEVKKKQTLDYAGLACILRPFSGGGAFVAVELVGAMPGQGVSSMFKFGQCYGAALATLATLEIPYELVTPPVWKRAYRLIGCEKDESRAAALRLFPQCAGDLKLKKHHGRADALLMAEYLRRQEVKAA